ncbi:MAG: serine protease [Potamolinea sp.]
MTASLESSIVRIYSKSEVVIGAGFLVSSQHVLTCAHVVADALELERETAEMPDAEIYLDFPILASRRLFKARVVFWRPVNPNELQEDIAGLELESSPPNTARPARLVTSENLWGHPFQVLGFPAGKSNGVQASGVLRGQIANGWVQLEDVKQAGYRLEPGFSGAPVWDEELQGVAGMAVAAELDRLEVKAAFIIPASQLAKAWNKLNQQVIHPEIWRRVNTQAKDTVEPGAVTQNLHELPTTNYNYGFIVDRLNYRELSDGSRVYSLDVFNRNYADGVIESRSKQGELIDIRGIESTIIPASVGGFAFMSIERLWRLSTEGYDFLDPRNSLGNSQKTEVRNIKVPPGGTLKLTKSGENVLIYNQATFLAALFFDSPNITGLIALCEKLQKKNLGSFVRSEIVKIWMKENLSIPIDKALEVFSSSSWIDNQKLEQLKQVCEEVMQDQKIKPNKNIFGMLLNIPGLEILKIPINATEDFMKHSNRCLQWLDWERSQIVEEQQGALFIHCIQEGK